MSHFPLPSSIFEEYLRRKRQTGNRIETGASAPWRPGAVKTVAVTSNFLLSVNPVPEGRLHTTARRCSPVARKPGRFQVEKLNKHLAHLARGQHMLCVLVRAGGLRRRCFSFLQLTRTSVFSVAQKATFRLPLYLYQVLGTEYAAYHIESCDYRGASMCLSGHHTA